MRIRYVVLALLALLSIITYLDRVCISVAGTRIQEDLEIRTQHWGWVQGVFLLSYGFFEIPSGALGDRFGQRVTLFRIVLWWSLFTMLTGATTGLTSLLVCRFLFGIGEAGAFPNASGTIRRWFPRTESGRAQGVVWGASRLGGMLAPVLVIPLMRTVGWRAMFFIFGLLGVVWAAGWLWWFRDRPRQHAAVTAEELAELDDGHDSESLHVGIPWRALLASRPLWLLMAMYAFYVWGAIFFLTWFPEYLEKGRGLSEEARRWATALPFLLGALGNLAGGFMTDFLSRRYGLIVGRSWMGAACLAVSGALMLATTATSDSMTAVLLLAVSFAVMDCMLPTAWALCLDIGGRWSGAVSGAMNSAGQAGGFVCTVLFGYVVGDAGRYDAALAVIASMVLVSSALFLCVDPTRPLVLERPPEAEGI